LFFAGLRGGEAGFRGFGPGGRQASRMWARTSPALRILEAQPRILEPQPGQPGPTRPKAHQCQPPAKQPTNQPPASSRGRWASRIWGWASRIWGWASKIWGWRVLGFEDLNLEDARLRKFGGLWSGVLGLGLDALSLDPGARGLASGLGLGVWGLKPGAWVQG